MIHTTHDFNLFAKGTKVRLHSLKNRVDLNGMLGTTNGFILRERVGVIIDANGEGVNVKKGNMDRIMTNGVRFSGSLATHDVESCKVSVNSSFLNCPIPNKLGIPLYAFLETPAVSDFSSPNHGVWLMANVADGFAPKEWQYGGVNGPMPKMQLGRNDGVDFTCDDLTLLVDFLGELFEDSDLYDPQKIKYSNLMKLRKCHQFEIQACVGLLLTSYKSDRILKTEAFPNGIMFGEKFKITAL